MPIRLARTLVREISGLFVLGVAAVSLLLSIDLLSVLARFLVEHGATPTQTARLLASKIPWFLHLALPVAATFAVLVAGGRMARDAELKAAQAGGVRPRQLLLPVLAWSVAVAGVAVVNNGLIEPRAERSYRQIVEGFLYLRPPAATERDASFVVEGAVFHASRVRSDPERPGEASLDGVLLRLADGTLRTARSGRWTVDPSIWSLGSGWSLPPGGDPQPAAAADFPFPSGLPPDATLTRDDTRTLPELMSAIREREQVGAASADLRFQLHRRLADAAAVIAFVTVAGALAFRLRGRAGGVAWTIVLVAAFWAAWTLTGELYERSVLSPVVAAWSTPLLVAVVGLAAALRSDRA